MFCRAILYYHNYVVILLYHAMLSYQVKCMLCYTRLFHIMPFYTVMNLNIDGDIKLNASVTIRYDMICYDMSSYVTVYDCLLRYLILCHVIWHYFTALCQAVLRYSFHVWCFMLCTLPFMFRASLASYLTRYHITLHAALQQHSHMLLLPLASTWISDQLQPTHMMWYGSN